MTGSKVLLWEERWLAAQAHRSAREPQFHRGRLEGTLGPEPSPSAETEPTEWQ